jgi:hypothetical protein
VTERQFFAALAEHELKPVSVSFAIKGDTIAFEGTFQRSGPADTEALATAFVGNPQVQAFNISPRA